MDIQKNIYSQIEIYENEIFDLEVKICELKSLLFEREMEMVLDGQENFTWERNRHETYVKEKLRHLNSSSPEHKHKDSLFPQHPPSNS